MLPHCGLCFWFESFLPSPEPHFINYPLFFKISIFPIPLPPSPHPLKFLNFSSGFSKTSLLSQSTCLCFFFPPLNDQTYRGKKRLDFLSVPSHITFQFSVAWLWLLWLQPGCSLNDLLILNPMTACQIPTLTSLQHLGMVAFFGLSNMVFQVHYPPL